MIVNGTENTYFNQQRMKCQTSFKRWNSLLCSGFIIYLAALKSDSPIILNIPMLFLQYGMTRRTFSLQCQRGRWIQALKCSSVHIICGRGLW